MCKRLGSRNALKYRSFLDMILRRPEDDPVKFENTLFLLYIK